MNDEFLEASMVAYPGPDPYPADALSIDPEAEHGFADGSYAAEAYSEDLYRFDECSVCLGDHDDEIHAATLSVKSWFRDEVTKSFRIVPVEAEVAVAAPAGS